MTVVYLHIGENNDVLYVGVATDLAARQYQHERESPWILDVARTLTVPCVDKRTAHEVERELIAKYNPPNNWLGRSVPNTRPRPSRAENVAATQARFVDRESYLTTAHWRVKQAAMASLDAWFRGERRRLAADGAVRMSAPTVVLHARRVLAEDVAVGDELIFLGEGHIIREVRPYSGCIDGLDVSSWRLASDAHGWSITLIPGQGFWIGAST